MSTTSDQPIISMSQSDLEALVRRVVREELTRLARASARSVVDDWSHEGPDDPEGDKALLAEALVALMEYQEQPSSRMTWEEFEAELTGNPNNSHAHYELGKALLQQADVAGAVSNLEIAVKLEPENALLHYELSRAYTAAGRREEGKRANDTFNRLKKQAAPDQTHQ